jgi:hypothetical protein
LANFVRHFLRIGREARESDGSGRAEADQREARGWSEQRDGRRCADGAKAGGSPKYE